MIVRLHHLSTRRPTWSDVEVVTALLAACDACETGSKDAEMCEEDVRKLWQAPDFRMHTDAWLIVHTMGTVVGYAEVRWSEDGKFTTQIAVHPDYRGRGIGTLLNWLTEERARCMLASICPDVQMVLSATASNANPFARHLYEREGYRVVRQFWRLLIEIAEVPASRTQQQRGLKFDLKIDAKSWHGTTHLQEQAGMYSAHLYDVYEKVLRAGCVTREAEALLVCQS